MSNDNKTLADVQPGGTVRLGDHDEKPPQELPDLIVTRGDGIPLPDQAAGIEEFKRQCLRRIEAEYPHLAAQPSPGGQGDAQTIEKLRAMMDHSFGGPGFVVYGTEQSIAEVERRLAPGIAARQPVGEITDTEIDARLNALYREMVDSGQHNGGMSGVAWDRAVYRMASGSPAQAVDLGQLIPSELAPVVAALNRFDECAEDCDSEGCDIGRDWFDALTTIGLLKRTQRSPAVWTMTAEGERLLALINGKAVGNG